MSDQAMPGGPSSSPENRQAENPNRPLPRTMATEQIKRNKDSSVFACLPDGRPTAAEPHFKQRHHDLRRDLLASCPITTECTPLSSEIVGAVSRTYAPSESVPEDGMCCGTKRQPH
ncbi:hypothetical protein CGLO_10678 [Colletotrichum gloeosporioides Cg-14]|uniref:Uncharacterized protein n=1 Tax=Colletotrichum gloeosporioides (strain Cg-14) TaxID=1237896 RepID=T0LEI2_COLGC|nr:hypothetical protein CGLO_10678 [Colletotrichum gloeosporioides Cg-14]